MKKIIDNIFFNNKKPIELNYNYIYDKYKENELTQLDNAISSNATGAFSYIRIQIDLRNDYENYNLNTDSSNIINKDKIIEISSYENLPKNLIKLFLTPETSNPKNSFMILDNNFEDLISYYNVYKEKSELTDVNYSTKICIDDSFLNKFEISNKKSPFYSIYSSNIIKSYNKIYEESLETPNFNILLNEGNFLGKYVPYNQKANIRMDSNLYKDNPGRFFQFIGFYVVKFKKDELDKDETYKKIASRFVLNQPVTTGLNIQVINDEYIKYGSVYKYLIFPVHTLTIKSYDSLFTHDQVFICDYPLITEEIKAVKTARPSPPSNIVFNLNKTTKKIEINWDLPYDKEGDAKGFQVFKRYNLEEPFTLVKEFRGHLSSDAFVKNQLIQPSSLEITPGIIQKKYIDYDFKVDKVNIYAICTIDAHGLVSNYSSQIGIVYDAILEKILVNEISPQGASLEYPNMLVPRKTAYFNNEEGIITNLPFCKNKTTFKFYFTPDCKKVTGQWIRSENNQKNVIADNIDYTMSIFRINGQKSIAIEGKEPKITIRNFI